MSTSLTCRWGRLWRLSGVTLLELLVTTSTLAVLLGLAVPSLNAFLQTWQRDRAIRALTGHLSLARTEAMRTGRPAVVCISTDAKTCAASTVKDWKQGWLVYIDSNSNGKLDADETVVATAGHQSGVRSMEENKTTRNFTFNPNGLMASGMCTVTVQPPLEPAYNITISRVGRVRVDKAK